MKKVHGFSSLSELLKKKNKENTQNFELMPWKKCLNIFHYISAYIALKIRLDSTTIHHKFEQFRCWRKFCAQIFVQIDTKSYGRYLIQFPIIILLLLLIDIIIGLPIFHSVFVSQIRIDSFSELISTNRQKNHHIIWLINVYYYEIHVTRDSRLPFQKRFLYSDCFDQNIQFRICTKLIDKQSLATDVAIRNENNYYHPLNGAHLELN